MEMPTIKFFEQYIDELRDSEYNANRQMGSAQVDFVVRGCYNRHTKSVTESKGM